MFQPQIDASWLEVLGEELLKGYMDQLYHFLLEDQKHYQIFPPNKFIFNAFNLTPYEKIRVVILGQDPYHKEGQAHGLAFSVPKGVNPPPSLVNIYKELEVEYSYPQSQVGDLTTWARQGVLLLNTTLTVRQSQPQSHFGKGWERFTDAVISTLNHHQCKLVFLLWGSNARSKAKLIDSQRHTILEAAHPSPLSAYRGFFGCNHFELANRCLIHDQQSPINWQV